mmetsp:Transcript_122580/g.347539  ORF Transcript_122580/g.347539 Transcript_122580/m.347539 type:complete len:94 (+) Transcript_122580:104-385(+)
MFSAGRLFVLAATSPPAAAGSTAPREYRDGADAEGLSPRPPELPARFGCSIRMLEVAWLFLATMDGLRAVQPLLERAGGDNGQAWDAPSPGAA